MDRMLQFFKNDTDNNEVIEFVDHLATKIAEDFPQNPERTVALRKLLECRDALIRTRDYEEPK